jgi:hypothetical protein
VAEESNVGVEKVDDEEAAEVSVELARHRLVEVVLKSIL